MMEVSVIRNIDDFIRLESTWNSMVQDCHLSIFSSFNWLSTWCKHFGKKRKLIILIAQENGKIVGIAPLMYSVNFNFGYVGVIKFIGDPQSDYNDFLILDKPEEVLRYFTDYLKHVPERWRCIKLTNMPETSQKLEAIKKIFKDFHVLCKSPFVKKLFLTVGVFCLLSGKKNAK